MSFIYPRTLKITRPGAQPSANVGDQGAAPNGDRATETLVLDAVRASIQVRGRQGKSQVGLPADADQAEWEILIPRSACARGTIQENDFITDDLGERYQVSANYWNSLGYALRAIKQKA